MAAARPQRYMEPNYRLIEHSLHEYIVSRSHKPEQVAAARKILAVVEHNKYDLPKMLEELRKIKDVLPEHTNSAWVRGLVGSASKPTELAGLFNRIVEHIKGVVSLRDHVKANFEKALAEWDASRAAEAAAKEARVNPLDSFFPPAQAVLNAEGERGMRLHDAREAHAAVLREARRGVSASELQVFIDGANYARTVEAGAEAILCGAVSAMKHAETPAGREGEAAALIERVTGGMDGAASRRHSDIAEEQACLAAVREAEERKTGARRVPRVRPPIDTVSLPDMGVPRDTAKSNISSGTAGAAVDGHAVDVPEVSALAGGLPDIAALFAPGAIGEVPGVGAEHSLNG